MSCGSDSDKWPRPSNMNLRLQKLQTEITLFAQPSGRYIKIQIQHLMNWNVADLHSRKYLW